MTPIGFETGNLSTKKPDILKYSIWSRVSVLNKLNEGSPAASSNRPPARNTEEAARERQEALTDEDDDEPPAIVAETWYAAASWGIGGNGESVFPLYKDRTDALQDLEKRWTKQILENAGDRLINPYLAWTREEAQEALNEYLEEQADD